MQSLRSTPRYHTRLASFLGGICLAALSTVSSARADTASVVTAANTLLATSEAANPNATSTSTIPAVMTDAYTLAIAKQWTNLPGGTRNGPTIGGGPKALTTDLSAAVPTGQTVSPRAAAIALCEAALSDAGYNTMNEIRNADDVIRATDNTQSWNYGNYHVAILGTPSNTAAWMLQISGHHLTYNITYNGPYISATPMFIGTEPPDYYSIGTDLTSTEETVVVGTVNGTTMYYVSHPYNATSTTTATATDPGVSSGTHRAPLETQRAAVSALADSIQADAANASAAKLTGTFSDVVLGVTGGGGGGGGPGGPGGPGGGGGTGGDSNFPFIGTNPTYPTGTTGRGVLYTSLNATEKAEVKTMIEAWVNTQASDIAASLLADYLSDAALAQTYVGYQVGAGSADGGAVRANFDALINEEETPINSQNSYIRVDGPRVWIEFVVQAAVAFKAQNFVHYHSLWRDRLADYGNEFGGYLDTTSTDTTYTRPTITTAPASASVASGGSATFSVTATGTGTLSYQWYHDAAAISGATSSSYVVSNATSASAGGYCVVVTNAYGVTISPSATLTVTTAGAPVITSAATASGTTGVAFTYQITASASPTKYGVQGLPGGLSVNATTGVLSGTPKYAGTYSLTLNATNSAGKGSAPLTLTIALGPPVITSATTATGTTAAAFSYQIVASGSPTSYGVQGLPGGLSVNATTGVISGTPKTAGTYTLTLHAYNSAGKGSATLTLKVTLVAPVITSATTASGTVGTAFSYQIVANGSPTSYGVQGLPAGLSVSSTTGLISGTPKVAGNYTLTLNAYNSAGKGSATLTLSVTK